MLAVCICEMTIECIYRLWVDTKVWLNGHLISSLRKSCSWPSSSGGSLQTPYGERLEHRNEQHGSTSEICGNYWKIKYFGEFAASKSSLIYLWIPPCCTHHKLTVTQRQRVRDKAFFFHLLCYIFQQVGLSIEQGQLNHLIDAGIQHFRSR